MNMVDIIRKTYERNGIETIIHNDGITWLNENHVEEGLELKNFPEILIKYYSNHRYELVDKSKYNATVFSQIENLQSD